MKTSLLLLAAPLAAAFILPNEQQILSVFSDDDNNNNNAIADAHHHEKSLTANSHHSYDGLEEEIDSYSIPDALAWHHVSGLVDALQSHIAQDMKDLEGPPPSKGEKCHHSKYDKKKKKKKHHADEHHFEDGKGHHGHGAQRDVFDAPPPHKPGFFDKVKGHLMHFFGPPRHHELDGYGYGKPPKHAGFPHHHHHHHHPHKYNQTIYELISSSNHTRIFTKIISKYDEVVEYLNSTKANYTIFVPLDDAFRHIHHKPNVSKAAVLKWLEYHVSPKVFTKRDFFEVQTVPTFLPEGNDGKFPQRISTQVGFRGLSLNFFAHVIRSDIFATNGVIHGIDEFLIPPFGAADTLELLPSVFSTLNLGLIKTGLIDIFNSDVPKSGGTFFAPSNHAFNTLGPKINAFLFSRVGRPYLKALLKYHIIANHTLFSDAYYKPKSTESQVKHGQHLDLPTLLHNKPLSIDIYHLHRLAHIVLNDKTHVVVPNVPVREGVIHVVSTVIIPPRPDSSREESEEPDHPPTGEYLSVRDLKERLEGYLD
ncbi:FAS1 domain-containing protein [Talaromyces proteolyticus]|uniref:FAS1 domain-containing protein n=1 Tax=Talaromyces proteolyticus TaxID=1131652 RepID=A0AAD4KFJ8_9EURO|nr:FAS1 domain-containing protein [Talaromyces proteolyticus]KAH8689841.1 FAS1 domain-containing protein [Talaromyces proteolyticus]